MQLPGIPRTGAELERSRGSVNKVPLRLARGNATNLKNGGGKNNGVRGRPIGNGRRGDRPKTLTGRQMTPISSESFRSQTFARTRGDACDDIAQGRPEPAIRLSTLRPINSPRHVSVQIAAPFHHREEEQDLFDDQATSDQQPQRAAQCAIDLRGVLKNPFGGTPRNPCGARRRYRRNTMQGVALFITRESGGRVVSHAQTERRFAQIWTARAYESEQPEGLPRCYRILRSDRNP